MIHGQNETFLRPLGFLSLFLDYRLWHLWPAGYHLTNLAIHLGSLAGLFVLLKRLGLGEESSSTALLIFAIHPITPEAVTWMGARFDLLAALFSIWSLAFYLKFRNSGRMASYLIALIFFVFAIFSKESSYVLPGIIISLEICATRDRRWRPAMGFIAVALLGVCYRFLVLGGIGGYSDPNAGPAALSFKLQTIQGLFLRAPAQLLFGYNWQQPPAATTIIIASIAAATLLLAATAFCQAPAKRNFTWLSICWIFLATLPAHFLLMIGAGLTNSRVLYPAVPAIAILISILLAGIHHDKARLCCKWTFVAMLAFGLMHNLNAWRHTGSMSCQLLSELRRLEPSPPQGAEFVFTDLPDTVRGVFFFHAGLADAIKLAYQRSDIDARRVTDAAGQTGLGSGRKPEIRVRWLGRPDKLIEQAWQ